MKEALVVAQVIISICLSSLILLQAKGVGLGRTFGASNYHSKRGVEKLVFRATIVLSVVFVVSALVSQLFVQ